MGARNPFRTTDSCTHFSNSINPGSSLGVTNMHCSFAFLPRRNISGPCRMLPPNYLERKLLSSLGAGHSVIPIFHHYLWLRQLLLLVLLLAHHELITADRMNIFHLKFKHVFICTPRRSEKIMFAEGSAVSSCKGSTTRTANPKNERKIPASTVDRMSVRLSVYLSVGLRWQFVDL